MRFEIVNKKLEKKHGSSRIFDEICDEVNGEREIPKIEFGNRKNENEILMKHFFTRMR